MARQAKKATAKTAAKTRGGKNDPVRWGVISTALIGTAKVIPGMQKSKELVVQALASRSLAKGKKAARKLGIPVVYGSYEELLDDPDIEAIYNPLPNHLHVPLTLQAAAKGKHVLCEKPIALNAAEAEQLRSVPKNVLIAEAFMVRHHPQWIMARDMARKGRLGTVRAIQVLFSYTLLDPNNIRNMADIGGGAAYDIGCYAIISGRYIFGAEPLRVISAIDRDPKFGTDRTTSALIDFGEGRHLTFTTSTQATPYQRVHILGTKARLEIEIPFNAPQGGSMKLYLDNGSQFGGAAARTIRLPKADQYQLQGEAFSRAVRGKEKLGYGVEDSILQMRVIDAIFRSEKSNAWEKP
ncbi:MAG: Gfo/Idh/MocA family oxidoreductase [Bauldia sp.]